MFDYLCIIFDHKLAKDYSGIREGMVIVFSYDVIRMGKCGRGKGEKGKMIESFTYTGHFNTLPN